MAAILVWPSARRCRVAATPPAQLVAPIAGTSGGGSPAGSTTTNGMFLVRSCRRWSAVRFENCSTIATGFLRRTPVISSSPTAW
jgi:hypothetical protein